MNEGEGEEGRELTSGTLRKIGRGTGRHRQVQEGGTSRKKKKKKGKAKSISERQRGKKRKERCNLFFIDWALKMRMTGCPETSVTTNLRCVKSHKSKLLTYIRAES
jgi:hypothetical protein